jgi:hypothetical protein
MHLLDFNFYNLCVGVKVFHCVQGKASWCHGSTHNIFQFEALVHEVPKAVEHILLQIPHWSCGVQNWPQQHAFTTTYWGYFAIQISSQTTKKDVSEISLLRTIIPRKFLSFCDTITFVPVQSQVLRNSRTWYNRKTFPITTASIHCLQLTLHRKLFATNPSPQRFSELTQKSIGFRYNI